MRGIFQYKDPLTCPVSRRSPWLRAVRMLPTTTAAMAERFSIGRCSRAHTRHFVGPDAGSGPGARSGEGRGGLKAKDGPLSRLFRHRAHTFVSALVIKRLMPLLARLVLVHSVDLNQCVSSRYTMPGGSPKGRRRKHPAWMLRLHRNRRPLSASQVSCSPLQGATRFGE